MRKYGFNMQWMFQHSEKPPEKPNLDELDFIAKRDFNFIRVPLDYQCWTKDYNYLSPDERVLELIDTYYEACRERGLHMCLNIHRAPGYCINNNLPERHSLWVDQEAQDGFVFLWEYFAKKYKGIPSSELSFDLLNEPPPIGRGGFTRENHQMVMRRTIAAIRAIDPSREITLNGINGGSDAIPELADTGTIHSGRGYDPFTISHYKAEWLPFEHDWEEPAYPCYLDGVLWDKEQLKKSYDPWRAVEKQGVEIFMGEIGSHNNTPNDVVLSWMTDLLDIYREYKWGYALWHFRGSYGIVEHGKPGAKYEMLDGFKVDRTLLELLMNNRVYESTS